MLGDSRFAPIGLLVRKPNLTSIASVETLSFEAISRGFVMPLSSNLRINRRGIKISAARKDHELANLLKSLRDADKARGQRFSG